MFILPDDSEIRTRDWEQNMIDTHAEQTHRLKSNAQTDSRVHPLSWSKAARIRKRTQNTLPLSQLGVVWPNLDYVAIPAAARAKTSTGTDTGSADTHAHNDDTNDVIRDAKFAIGVGAFFSRAHFDAFGYFAPPRLRGSSAFEWLLSVFQQTANKRTHASPDVVVRVGTDTTIHSVQSAREQQLFVLKELVKRQEEQKGHADLALMRDLDAEMNEHLAHAHALTADEIERKFERWLEERDALKNEVALNRDVLGDIAIET